MKLLFIGARLFDDLAPYIKEKGITSILTESNQSSPNLELADSVHIVPRGMEAPMELAIKEDVDGVIPLIGIDSPLMQVAHLKEELESNYDIPVVAPNISAATISTNKTKSKHFFRKNDVKTPSFDIIYQNDLSKTDISDNLKFPLVLKQEEGQGGKDIKVASQKSELDEYFQEFDQAIVEEFISGFEISVEVLSWRGDSIPLAAVYKGRTTLTGIHPLDKLKSAPAEIEGLNNDLALELAHKITRKLGSEGNTDVDLIFNPEDQELYALEMNTRPSGTRYLTTASTGINPLNELVDMALGEWKSKNVKNAMKDYSAIEVPIMEFKGSRNDLNPKIFSCVNSWVVHGPQKFERVTIRGEDKNKVSEIARNLKINLSSFQN
jgi:carbamoylphosphate synthase large subunit